MPVTDEKGLLFATQPLKRSFLFFSFSFERRYHEAAGP